MDASITLSSVTPADIKNALVITKKTVAMLKAFAALTPTTYDDAALAFVEKLVAILEPYADEPALASIINFVLGLVQKKGVAGAADSLAALVA